MKPEAREVLFLGLDMETREEVPGRQPRVRGAARPGHPPDDALAPDTMLAFALNGQPIPAEQGFPVRLLVPGWYGMTQVKWLGRIEVLDRRYEGQHQVRNYLSLRSMPTPDGPMWLDTSISEEPAQVDRRARHPARHDGQWDLPGLGPGLGRLGADHGGRGAGRRRRRGSRPLSTRAGQVRLGPVVLDHPRTWRRAPTRWSRAPSTPPARCSPPRRSAAPRSPAAARTTRSGCARSASTPDHG